MTALCKRSLREYLPDTTLMKATSLSAKWQRFVFPRAQDDKISLEAETNELGVWKVTTFSKNNNKFVKTQTHQQLRLMTKNNR